MAESSALSARNRHNITGDNFTFQSIRNQDLKINYLKKYKKQGVLYFLNLRSVFGSTSILQMC